MEEAVFNVSYCKGSCFDDINVSNGELAGTMLINCSIKNAIIINVDASQMNIERIF